MPSELQSNTLLKIKTEINISDTINECQNDVRPLDFWVFDHLNDSINYLRYGQYHLASNAVNIALAENVHPIERTRSSLLDHCGAELLLRKLDFVTVMPTRY